MDEESKWLLTTSLLIVGGAFLCACIITFGVILSVVQLLNRLVH